MTDKPFLEPVYRFIRNQQLILILLAVLTGSAASFGAIVFREAIVIVQSLAFGASLEQMSEFFSTLPDWQIILVPTGAGGHFARLRRCICGGVVV